MKLDKKTADGIAETCADRIIECFGEKRISSLPYDVLSAEISGLIEDIEDRIDRIIASKIEGSLLTNTVENLWEND